MAQLPRTQISDYDKYRACELKVYANIFYSEIIPDCVFFTSNSGCWWCCSERGIFLVLVHSSFFEAAIRKAIVSYSHLIGNCTAGKFFYNKFCKHSTWILFQFAMSKNGMGIDQIRKTLKSDSKFLTQ